MFFYSYLTVLYFYLINLILHILKNIYLYIIFTERNLYKEKAPSNQSFHISAINNEILNSGYLKAQPSILNSKNKKSSKARIYTQILEDNNLIENKNLKQEVVAQLNDNKNNNNNKPRSSSKSSIKSNKKYKNSNRNIEPINDENVQKHKNTRASRTNSILADSSSSPTTSYENGINNSQNYYQSSSIDSNNSHHSHHNHHQNHPQIQTQLVPIQKFSFYRWEINVDTLVRLFIVA